MRKANYCPINIKDFFVQIIRVKLQFHPQKTVTLCIVFTELT